MSGLGGHQQKSWVLICVMRKVEIRKEHAKQTKKKKKQNSRNTVWKRGERDDETSVVRYYSVEDQTGKTLGKKKREPRIQDVPRPPCLEVTGNDTTETGRRSHGVCEPQKPNYLQAWVPWANKPLIIQQSLNTYAHQRKNISTIAVSKWKFQGQFNRPKNLFFPLSISTMYSGMKIYLGHMCLSKAFLGSFVGC